MIWIFLRVIDTLKVARLSHFYSLCPFIGRFTLGRVFDAMLPRQPFGPLAFYSRSFNPMWFDPRLFYPLAFDPRSFYSWVNQPYFGESIKLPPDRKRILHEFIFLMHFIQSLDLGFSTFLALKHNMYRVSQLKRQLRESIKVLLYYITPGEKL